MSRRSEGGKAHSTAKGRKPRPLLAISVSHILLHVVEYYAQHPNATAAFVASSFPARSAKTAFFHSDVSDSDGDDGGDPPASACSMGTKRLATASGKPVCRYALGGAARSVQPESLPLKYRDLLLPSEEHAADDDDDGVAPFYFYYNPHRYPAFLSGIARSWSWSCGDDDDANNPNCLRRDDVFIASGGTDRSPAALDERLVDALETSGGEYLDAFVLEYVCPHELASGKFLGKELRRAIEHVHRMKREGKVRYVMASTHSHSVGSALAAATIPPRADNAPGDSPAFDALMLRYSMSHKVAAESVSLPIALGHNIPVLAFTTTRWNRLQSDPAPGATTTDSLPTTSDCIKFALQHPAIELVLHSARDEEELDEAMLPLFSCSSSRQSSWLPRDQYEHWRDYGDDEMKWNEDDEFDEYPEEMVATN